MAPKRKQTKNKITFGILWFGQVVSLLGSHLTAFAIGLAVLEKNNSVTEFSLTFFAALVPELMLAPLAGTLIDRWNRRFALIVGHAGAGLCTVGLVVFHLNGSLEFPILIALVALSSAFNSFQYPGMTSATTLLVPKEFLAQASGLIQVGFGLAQLTAPVIAGFLLESVGLEGVLIVDVCTFTFAIFVLVGLRFPQARVSAAGVASKGSFLSEMRFGWSFIRERLPLMSLLFYLGVLNFSGGLIWTLMAPLIMRFGKASELGIVLSCGGAGILIGGALMMAWGGPSRLALGILMSVAVQGILLIATTPFPAILPMLILMVGAGITFPIVMGCSDAIWQRKVPPDIQAKVFSFRPIITGIPMAAAILLSGPIADQVFEPLMLPDGALASTFGPLFGTGPGRGIALLLFGCGVFSVVWSVVGFLFKPLRCVDILLPDYHPLFGQMAIDMEFITEEGLWQSLKWQRIFRNTMKAPFLLGEIMVMKHIITSDQLDEVIRKLGGDLQAQESQPNNVIQLPGLHDELAPITAINVGENFHDLTLLGDVLVALNSCTQDHVLVGMDQQVAEASTGTGRPLGRILVEENRITADQLKTALLVLDALRKQDL